MSSHKTNNSFLKTKIYIRLKAIEDNKKYLILNCFNGRNEIWGNIKNKNITVHGLDILDYKNTVALIGNNIKTLPNLNLEKYNIIDLDAYGVPDKQLDIIIDKCISGTIVFYTFIQSVLGRLPDNILLKNGYSKLMIDKCTSLFSKAGFDKFKNYLSTFGVTKTEYINHGRKYYGYFIIP